MTTQERVIALRSAGFDREAIAAILGIGEADVAAAQTSGTAAPRGGLGALTEVEIPADETSFQVGDAERPVVLHLDVSVWAAPGETGSLILEASEPGMGFETTILGKVTLDRGNETGPGETMQIDQSITAIVVPGSSLRVLGVLSPNAEVSSAYARSL